MEDIIIEANAETPHVPKVAFKASTGVCSIQGGSYLENALSFYAPLLDWLIQYKDEGKDHIDVSVKLPYFNTSSSRCMLDMFRLLKQMREQGKAVSVVWYYPSSDPDSLMDGEDFMKESGLEMGFIEYDDETNE